VSRLYNNGSGLALSQFGGGRTTRRLTQLY